MGRRTVQRAEASTIDDESPRGPPLDGHRQRTTAWRRFEDHEHSRRSFARLRAHESRSRGDLRARRIPALRSNTRR